MNLPGVYRAQKKDGTTYYRASFTYKNKHISLGSFGEVEEAHEAYCEALSLTQNPALGVDDFPKEGPLSFEKWVCIVNFRDNGLYFSTPIYVYPKYFYYYLSRKIRLTFDIDDLFFYSSHKIMQRKGHLFVADYGMQLNIVNRYGIKNYAVEGKDYRFRNGDCHDFRYENIEIFNTYHGVRSVTHKGKKKFRVQIHVHGNYLVGYYDTDTEAAIAYNKAIDILKRNGCKKSFTPNEPELSPSLYAKIYSQLKIAPGIQNYREA